MDERERFYITTAIDYPNSRPHIGTAFEKIGADVQARFRRMEGLRRPLPDGQRREHRQGVAARRRAGPRAQGLLSTTWPGSSRRSGRRSRSASTTSSRPARSGTTSAAGSSSRRCTTTATSTRASYAGLVLRRLRGVQDREGGRGSRRRLPEPPRRRSSGVEEPCYFFALSAFQDRLLKLLRGEPRLHPAGEPAQRDRQPGRDRAAGRRHHPQGVHLGHPGPVRPGADDLRLVRRPAELHHRHRLRHRRGAVPHVLAGRRPRHRQGHHALPLRPLAGDADVGRASSCPARCSGTASSTARTRRPARSRRSARALGNVVEPMDMIAQVLVPRRSATTS